MRVYFSFFHPLLKQTTVAATRLAPLKLDWPPLITVYYLPYKNGKLQKFVLYTDNYSSFNWRFYEKSPTLGLWVINLSFK